jgi:hypothetical protein
VQWKIYYIRLIINARMGEKSTNGNWKIHKKKPKNIALNEVS